MFDAVELHFSAMKIGVRVTHRALCPSSGNVLTA